MPIVRRTLTAASLMLVTFAVLMAGSALVRETTVSTPLSRTMRALGIEHYAIGTQTADQSVVAVRLGNGADLESTVEGIQMRLTPILGHVPAVSVTGPGQVRLRAALQALDVPAEEAAATDNFVAMAETVREDATALHVRASLQVDNTAVYLTVIGPGRDGDAYLVVPRTDPVSGTSAAAMEVAR